MSSQTELNQVYPKLSFENTVESNETVEHVINDGLTFDHLCLKREDVDMVIYHGGCSDGYCGCFSAEYYLRKAFPDRKVDYVAGSFEKGPPNVVGRNVVLVDFSYKKNVLLKMISEAKSLIVLDHHKSAEGDLKDLPECNKLFRMDHSGGYLGWRYFHPTSLVPKFVLYIEDNDIWKKEMPNTWEFTAFQFSSPLSYDEFEKMLDEEYINNVMIPQGTGMVKQNNFIINKTIRQAAPKFMKIGNKYYFVCHLNSSVLKSEIGNKIFSKYVNANFDAIYSIDDYDNTTTFSLRSTEGRTDVSEIAFSFGGGGHACASGLTSKVLTNTLPVGTVLDNYKMYNLLDDVYLEELSIYGSTLNCVYLNCTNHKTAIGKYLLQTRSQKKIPNEETGDVNTVKLQEFTSVMRNREDNKSYSLSAHIAATWHYDGKSNKTYFVISMSQDLEQSQKEILAKSLSKLNDYSINDERIVVSIPGLKRVIDFKWRENTE
jgi:oligoribonuclease NrnB/cAMP/cGMP phosphodiesterase (DHH superfamily)